MKIDTHDQVDDDVPYPRFRGMSFREVIRPRFCKGRCYEEGVSRIGSIRDAGRQRLPLQSGQEWLQRM